MDEKIVINVDLGRGPEIGEYMMKGIRATW